MKLKACSCDWLLDGSDTPATVRGELKTSNNTALERVQKEEEELGISFHFLFTVKAFCNISGVKICVHARALGFIFFK